VTLADLLTQLGTSMAALVPDFEIYAAASVVTGLAIYAIRRVVKSGR
jgi:hypothetical protein